MDDKKIDSIKKDGGSSDNKCPVCNRSFQTKKAMHGHLRCHPEREWRGVNPPPSANTSSSSGRSTAKSDVRRCNICCREFATPQSLGGHMSGHTYKKNLQASKDGVGKETMGNRFKCKICNATFPSGQALGGHMRAHFQSPPAQEEASREVSQAAAPRVLGLDLNEPAPMEE